MSEGIRGTWLDDPSHFRRPNRRDFLYVGMLGGLGLHLGDALRLQSTAKADTVKEGRAKSVINIFLPGGASAQETFDPKLYAPEEYRGPFGHIATKIPGERFSEHMPRTAQIADKISVIRSMSHGEAAHERGVHNMMTGYRPSPALAYPSMGSVVAHEMGPRNNLPPYMFVPNPSVDTAGSGYLSSRFGPFGLGADPANANFRVRDLSLPSGVDETRFSRRQSMLSAVDKHFSTLEKSDKLEAMDSFYQQAYAMLSSKEAREAFDISAEPAELRKEYGENQAGMRMLMSRRLVEAGVRFVTMVYGGWDHHDNIDGGHKNLIGPTDQGFAALINDLDRRGMLDDTLVMVTTEFGRTPRINNTAGRDHWPGVFSIAMAGGGVKRGYVHGRSDTTSTHVQDDAVSVPDWAATIYELMGIEHEKTLMAPGDRPIEIVAGGRAVRDLLA
ncbi:MAG: DUF1501 domain-containing protein [Phycisphaeraceae bacterium]